MIAVDNLRKSYGDYRAVDDISFAVERGETFALLGPNGAGKTTTIEILEGFRARDGGAVLVAGLDPGRRENVGELRRKVGILLQKTALEPELSVLETVEAFRRYYTDPILAATVLDLVSLSDQCEKRVGTLSGGQLRRLDIALSVLGRPEVLFLDEPTTGLDPGARRRIWQLIRNLNDQGTTILLSSHYLDEVEALAHRLIVLSRGRIVASGKPASLRESLAGKTIVRLNEAEARVIELLPLEIASGASRNGSWIEFHTDDATHLIQILASVAGRNGRSLKTMVVVRPSLEDFYLDLLEREEAQAPQ
jgi:ABC-2 type transport system ATP-binding protein